MSEIFTLALIFSKNAEEKDMVFQNRELRSFIIKAFFLFNKELI